MNGSNRHAANGLLRFISKELDVETVVLRNGNEIHIQLLKDNILIGKRRLAKANCCQSESPCIGPIPIAPEFQDRFHLPAFIHVSLCYREILEFWEHQE